MLYRSNGWGTEGKIEKGQCYSYHFLTSNVQKVLEDQKLVKDSMLGYKNPEPAIVDHELGI